VHRTGYINLGEAAAAVRDGLLRGYPASGIRVVVRDAHLAAELGLVATGPEATRSGAIVGAILGFSLTWMLRATLFSVPALSQLALDGGRPALLAGLGLGAMFGSLLGILVEDALSTASDHAHQTDAATPAPVAGAQPVLVELDPAVSYWSR
jgi:hypothetical protein